MKSGVKSTYIEAAAITLPRALQHGQNSEMADASCQSDIPDCLCCSCHCKWILYTSPTITVN